MIARMDGHALLGDIALYSSICGDGGPRHYRRRNKPLPEKYLPGRFLAGMRTDVRADVVRAANDGTTLATWFLRYVVDEEEPRAALPPPPIDRRWGCRGRWASPTIAAAGPPAMRRRAEATR